METKRCPRCDETKSVADFYVNRARYDGLSGYCRACMTAADKQSAALLRMRVLAHLGGRCSGCGFEDIGALQVDHVNGGGRIDRALYSSNGAFLHAVLAASPGVYALLCANCNIIKRIDQSEHVGGRVYEREVPTERVLRGRAHVSDALTARAEERRTALLATVEANRAEMWSDTPLPPGSWSRHATACLGCKRSDRRHSAHGLCGTCNGIVRRDGRRAGRLVVAT